MAVFFFSPGERGLTGETAPDADVADTTATTTSGSEALLPDSGLLPYRRPVKRRGLWPLQARCCVRMEARGQSPQGRDSLLALFTTAVPKVTPSAAKPFKAVKKAEGNTTSILNRVLGKVLSREERNMGGVYLRNSIRYLFGVPGGREACGMITPSVADVLRW